MNGNDENKILSDEDSMRAKLCAVLLGEASDAERAEVETALVNSADLRAERARLEATIGLVSTALKEDGGAANELSTQAQAALAAAAAKRARPMPWHRTNGFRMAASFAVFVGAISVWRASISDTAPAGRTSASKPVDGLVASAPAAPRDELAKKAHASEGVADELSATVDQKALKELARAKTEQPLADADVPANNTLHFGVEAQLNAQFEKKPGEITGADLASLDTALGQVGDGSATWQLGKPVEDALERLSIQAQPQGLSDGSSTVLSVVDGTASSNPAPDPSVLYSARTGADPGIAAGDLNRFEAAGAAPTGSKGGGGGGRSGAPGDSVPAPAEKAAELKSRLAGVTSGPTTPAPPASAGPSGPSTPGAAPASKRVAGGELRKLEELRALGYVDNAEGEVDLDGFEIPMYRVDEHGRAIELDWHTRFERMQRTCWPRPNEKPRDMFFRYWGDNPFEITAFDKLSTFSIDVDTASYTNARDVLNNGHLPVKAAIRTEEFVNYFKGDVPAPREGTFNVATEFAPNMFGDSPDSWMLRVALRGREVQKHERMPLALTFIIDVSGSMRENERLELVKHALRLLVAQLDARDSISLVKFSTDAALVLPMTSARQRDLIESAINPLQPEGSTNTEAGLRMGYAQAVAALTQGSNNRVVLLTDGVANVGITDPNALTAMVENQRKAGIYLNTVGVGMNNHNDNLLEQLADKGDGMCNYVDDAKEVRRALVDNFTGAFETIARDVKIQVEFDPTQVERYRLLGYENRAIADVDFRNDKVDAGEVGAGHQVVALYEVVRTSASGDGPLATVHVRWKPPYRNGVADSESDVATEIAQPVIAKNAAGAFAQTGAGYRRSVLVAQFAEFLRRSIHARTDSVDRLVDEARKLSLELKEPDFDTFVGLVVKSRDLVLAELARRDWFDRCGDELRRRCYLQAQIDDLQRRLGVQRQLDELERDSNDLQRQLDALRLHLEGLQGRGDEETLLRLQRENIELQRRLLEMLSKERVAAGK